MEDLCGVIIVGLLIWFIGIPVAIILFKLLAVGVLIVTNG